MKMISLVWQGSYIHSILAALLVSPACKPIKVITFKHRYSYVSFYYFIVYNYLKVAGNCIHYKESRQKQPTK